MNETTEEKQDKKEDNKEEENTIKEDRVLFLLNNLTEEQKEELIDEIAEEKAKKGLKIWNIINATLLIILLILTIYAWTTGYFCHYECIYNPIGNNTIGVIINYTKIGGIP